MCVCVGVVYNYTRGGVRRDQSGWEHCVSVPLVRPDMFHLLAQWDQYLERFSDGSMWDPAWQRYMSHLAQVHLRPTCCIISLFLSHLSHLCVSDSMRMTTTASVSVFSSLTASWQQRGGTP